MVLASISDHYHNQLLSRGLKNGHLILSSLLHFFVALLKEELFILFILFPPSGLMSFHLITSYDYYLFLFSNYIKLGYWEPLQAGFFFLKEIF